LVGGVTEERHQRYQRANRISFLDTIYRYNPDEDSWTLLDERMKEKKTGVIAMLVDRNMFVSE
jgi:N-acetylneuraminic acid mutarotase